jgi:hypothetical protein
MTKQPSLKLITLARKLLGYVPLAFVLPAPAIAEKTLALCSYMENKMIPIALTATFSPRGGGIIV